MKTTARVPEIEHPHQAVAGWHATRFTIAAVLEVAWLLFLLWMTLN